jgi:hypothetical protein
MDNERTVNKILRDIKFEGLIDINDAPSLRKYINAAYVSGLEEGKKKSYAANKKTVILLNRNGDIIREFESAEEASRQMKVGVRGIYHSIYRDKKNHIKNYWKYK